MLPAIGVAFAIMTTGTAALAQDDPAASAQDAPASDAPAAETPARRSDLRFTPARRVVGAADLDGDRQVSAEEWSRFRREAGADEARAIDAARVEARVITKMIDQDGDGRMTLDDLFQIFEKVDRNIDFAIGREELEVAPPPARPTATQRNLFMERLPLLAADADDDGEVSADEWGAFIDAIEPDDEGRVGFADMAHWFEKVRFPEPLTEGDFSQLRTPGGFLRWLRDGLDPDGDGLLEVADLEHYFAGLDRDGDGLLSEDEQSFTSRARRPLGEGREPLMPWQRSLDDALARVAATGKPLLICVNMDGEAASEYLALARYRDPEFVELAQGFVPLLVSPDRRNARDHDDSGRRIVDRKFGRLVNTEHIEIEAELYERYFDGQRTAPRHLAVDAEGRTLFDIFLVNDLTLIDAALREHGVAGPGPADPAGLDETELLASPEALHREFLERRFAEGDERTRTRLAGLSISSARPVQHVEILRMALLDPAPGVRLAAVWAMVQHPRQAPLEFFMRAYQASEGDPVALGACVETLARIARLESSVSVRERATELHRSLAGLGQESTLIDVDRWRVALSWSTTPGAQAPVEGEQVLTNRLGQLEERLAVSDADPELNLAFAATNLRFAELLIEQGANPGFFLEDALGAATRAAEQMGPEARDGRALAYAARASYLMGDLESAAQQAARAAPRLLPWASTPMAMRTLEILADLRVRATYAALAWDGEWSADLIPDVRALHEILLEHPLGDESHAQSYLSYLGVLDVAHLQMGFLKAALERFPRSPQLHSEWRDQLLRTGGARALEAAYADLGLEQQLGASLEWFDGLALLMAAERHIENREEVQGLAAYELAVERLRFVAATEGEFREEATQQLCLAFAGIARVHLTSERWDEAVGALQQGISASAGSIWKTDGLGHAPHATAKLLVRSLNGAGLEAQAGELEAFLVAHRVPL